MGASQFSVDPQKRLVSLDVFRGLTMFLLVGESTEIYAHLVNPALQGTWIAWLGAQFDHHAWHGLHFWDLIQPFFMFIVGVAMPFSFGRRWQAGETWGQSLKHALRRSFLLLLFGWALYCISPGKLTFELWNVLAQLSVTYLIAFLMMRKSMPIQLGFTLFLLILSEMLYRLWPVVGFNQPFVPDHNFGSWVDLLIMGKLSNGHWVAFNAIPTTAHTMWGVLAGMVLQSSRTHWQKIKILLLAGLIGVVAGYALDPLTPIIKRICTSSFVIVSGGWSLLALALCYYIVDVLGWQKWAKVFIMVGMNSIFIYLFMHTGGAHWMAGIAKPFTFALFEWSGELNAEIATSLVVWGMMSGLCAWLYNRRIFFRI